MSKIIQVCMNALSAYGAINLMTVVEGWLVDSEYCEDFSLRPPRDDLSYGSDHYYGRLVEGSLSWYRIQDDGYGGEQRVTLDPPPENIVAIAELAWHRRGSTLRQLSPDDRQICMNIYQQFEELDDPEGHSVDEDVTLSDGATYDIMIQYTPPQDYGEGDVEPARFSVHAYEDNALLWWDQWTV